MIDSSCTRAGANDEFTSSQGRYGEIGGVTAHNIARATVTLVSGAFSNSSALNTRSGSGHQVGHDSRYASPMMRTVCPTGARL